MELTGSNKNITGIHSSSPYTNHHITRESSSETMDHNPDPDPFPITGASVTPISVGSKLMKPHMHITSVKYKECLKNHAANMGGNITDGCCEFMPSGDDGTLEALKCAACNCHRNFHRKEYYYPITTTPSSTPFLQLPPPSPSFYHHHRTPHPLSLHHHPINASPVKVAFGGGGGGCSGGGGGTESSSEELNFNSGVSVGMSPYGVMKKRFRTKFTQEQKDKMLEFAERVGWRIPREDDTEVQRFCTEVGVKRQVLKVWMHNNKATSGKKQVQDGVDSIN